METQELQDFKNKYIGKTVVVVDPKHAHYKETAVVSGVENTFAGLGMKLKNDDNTSCMYGEEFYIFRGNQIKFI